MGMTLKDLELSYMDKQDERYEDVYKRQDIKDKIFKLPEGVQIEVKGQLKFQES